MAAELKSEAGPRRPVRRTLGADAPAWAWLALLIAADVLAVLTFLLAPSDSDASVAAFWICVLLLGGTFAYAAYHLLKRVAGDSPTGGGRDTAIIVAFLAAALLSPEAGLSIVNGTVGGVRAFLTATPDALSERPPTVGATRVSRILACWSDPLLCPGQEARSLRSRSRDAVQAPVAAEGLTGTGADSSAILNRSASTGLHWLWFMLVLGIVLVFARSLQESERRWFNLEAQPEGLASPRGRRRIIQYPTWIAICLYAIILIPAGYCSIGTLLYLEADERRTSLGVLAERLEELDRDTFAEMSGVNLNTEALERLAGREGAGRAEINVAISNIRAAQADLAARRAKYKADAISNAAELRATGTPGDFEDYVLRLTTSFPVAIRDARQALRPCLEALKVVDDQLVAQARNAPDASTVNDSVPEGEGGGGVGEANMASAVDTAESACRSQTSTFREAPTRLSSSLDDSAFPGVLYGWLARSSQETVLIVGLIGFGLFGAAIRMLGRPGSPLAEGDAAASIPVGVTDNAARILIHGLGAAFSVFLGGISGSDFLTEGGETNAYALLLLCFAGAVFADEIWRAVESFVRRRSDGHVAGQPTGSTEGTTARSL